jgi:hypothetical protein
MPKVYQRTFYGSTTNLLLKQLSYVPSGLFDVTSHRRCRKASLVAIAGISNLLVSPSAVIASAIKPQLINGREQVTASLLHGSNKASAAGRSGQRIMEGQVGGLVCPWRGGPFERSDGFVHGREVGLCASHRGESGDLALDRNAVIDNVVQLVQVMTKPVHPLVVGHLKLRDETAAGRPSTSDDVTLFLQQRQRFSDTQTTDAKLIGQLSFGRQLVPRAELAPMDTRPHTISERAGTRSGRNQRGHIHQCAIGVRRIGSGELSHQNAKVGQ